MASSVQVLYHWSCLTMVMSSNFILPKKEGTFCLSSTFKLMTGVVEGESEEERCDLITD